MWSKDHEASLARVFDGSCRIGDIQVSAGVFATVLWSPDFPVHRLIGDTIVAQLIMGLAMGITAILLIYSPWGKQSGAHLNPAVTLSFFRLGKVKPVDAAFYVIAEFAGGRAGVALVLLMLGDSFRLAPINAVATLPGTQGSAVAFFAELFISFLLMMTVLVTSNNPIISRCTGVFAGLLLFVFITFESPLSGMSINPARSFGEEGHNLRYQFALAVK